ncbi:MAG TPA: hypothetical protein VHN18_07465 [Micromonosporaceae bacterium]|nr:hypothetical protein [Micromonosporaceae bacterium]
MGADEQEVSVRAYLRSLPSVALWMLLGCIGFWAVVTWQADNPPKFWHVLLAWPVVTVWIGPIMWLRLYRYGSSARIWSGLAVAALWSFCLFPILVGLAYGAAASLLGFDR